jgi:chromosome segregation ATPase
MGLFKKKPTVDPVDFLALRSELVVLQERLDQSEQAKAALEDRLTALAATTMHLSTTAKSDTAELVEQIESIHGRLDQAPDTASELSALQARLAEVESRPTPTVDVPDDLHEQLGNLSERLEHVSQLASAPVAPDDELAARLDALARNAEALDLLQRQVAQLSARVSAQSEVADQVTVLTDRIGLLQQRTIDSDQINERIDQIAAASAGATDLSERMVDVNARLQAAEQQAAEAAERAAAAVQRADDASAAAAAAAQRADEAGGQASAAAQRADESASRIGDLDHRLSLTAETTSSLEQRLAASADTTAALHRQLDELMATISSQPAAPGEPSGEFVERLAELDRRVAEASDSAAAAKSTSEAVAERAAASMAAAAEAQRQSALIDQRLQSVSTELANQLGELGRELDGLSGTDLQRAVAGGEVSDELLDALRSGQVKLAAEQARYEISFREDLAQLAEQVRHLRGR